MEFRHGSEMDYKTTVAGHRGVDLGFKIFFSGTPDTPENYLLLLGREEGSFATPRHRHPFDQFRLAYRGIYNVAPGADLDEGDLGYFPEGVYYGPRDGGHVSVDALVLQFGGASGQGYLSQEQLAEGFEALKQQGTFEGGIFRRDKGEGPRNQDGFEAVWERVTGRPLDYPKGRYQAPILMASSHFHYLPVAGRPGISRKALGTFSERCVRAEFFRLDSDATLQFPREQAVRLGFVIDGEGISGNESWTRESAFRLQADESGTMTARTPSVVFVITLPMIHIQAA